MQHVGILSIGIHLPPDVRPNSWWPSDTVAHWATPNGRTRVSMEAAMAKTTSSAQRMALQANLEDFEDPFKHCIERRVLASDKRPSEMEVAACAEALERAGINAKEIDYLFVNSWVPDYLGTNNACTVHERIGMRINAPAMSIEAACNSFAMALTQAQSMIRAGDARYILICQSTAASRVLAYSAPYSPVFGDGASAVLVGPVPATHGVLAHVHHTDGTMQGALVMGVRGKQWYDEGGTTLFAEDLEAVHRMFATILEASHDVAKQALAKAGMTAKDVNFFCCHQGQSWSRGAMQKVFELQHARTLDTFPYVGNITASNCPLILHQAEREGLLKKNDVVLMSSGGNGMTYSSVVMRWGTA